MRTSKRKLSPFAAMQVVNSIPKVTPVSGEPTRRESNYQRFLREEEEQRIAVERAHDAPMLAEFNANLKLLVRVRNEVAKKFWSQSLSDIAKCSPADAGAVDQGIELPTCETPDNAANVKAFRQFCIELPARTGSLVPSKDNPYFLMDFRVFQGNSGGPVYMISYTRTYGGVTHIGAVQMVVGLVTEEVSLTEELRGLYESRSERYPLGIAKVVPASILRDTVNQLPEPTADSK